MPPVKIFDSLLMEHLFLGRRSDRIEFRPFQGFLRIAVQPDNRPSSGRDLAFENIGSSLDLAALVTSFDGS